jgi:hypothetical protein
MNLNSLLMRAVRYFARRGLKDIARINPSESARLPEAKRPKPQPAGKMKLHLFGANFDSQAAADRFCYAPTGTDEPSTMTQQLEGAFIDEAQVEAVHLDIRARLNEFLGEEEADDIMLRLSSDNTLIILTEVAFGGFPYTLDDTDTLTYLGVTTVDV